MSRNTKIRIPEIGWRSVSGVSSLILILVLTACTTSRIDVARHVPHTMARDTGVVVLARKKQGGLDTEESFMECLTQALSKQQLPVNFYPEQDFVDSLFPWFEARTAPASLDELPALLRRHGVSEKIAELDVRYLIWVDGQSEKVDEGGGLSCAVGPGGGGCFGFVWWDTSSAYEAVIWDLQKNRSIGAVNADATGMSYIPALIVPVPLIARTQNAACNGLAEQLKEFFAQSNAL
jgi:hypothetical protein